MNHEQLSQLATENDNTKITAGLDYYKATMANVEHRYYPDEIATFRLINRGPNKLSEFVTPEMLADRISDLQQGWDAEEIAAIASIQSQDGKALFEPEYLDFLEQNPLPPVDISLDEDGELAVSTTGEWPLVTFWETVIMSQINELYFKEKLAKEGMSLNDLYEEGDRRLSEKIAKLKDRPDILISDFGTRRRFSYDWHKYVVERLAAELPDNFVGTSNVYLANKLGLKPIGTFAHELPMVYCAIEDRKGQNPLGGHDKMLRDWEETYGEDLSTALTDTFTTDFFFTNFTKEQAESWSALRHDSGDPKYFGDRVIEFYKENGVDPMEKTIVFSDGLDIDSIIELADYFKNRIKVVFGWGTTLTNDLGLKPNNFVMKAVEVGGAPTVKLSDAEGKHTGPIDEIEKYKKLVGQALGEQAIKSMAA